MKRKLCLWAVPLSSNAPHTAHLLVAGEGETTAKLCNASLPIVRRYAVAVNSGYELKCSTCWAMAREAAVVQRCDNALVTSRDVTEARRGMFPRSKNPRTRSRRKVPMREQR